MRAFVLVALVANSAGFVVPSAGRAPTAVAFTPKARLAAPEMVVDTIMAHTGDANALQQSVFDAVKKQLVRLEKNQVGVEEYVRTAGLTNKPEDYANPNLPHVVCAVQENQAFEQGKLSWGCKPGERVSYVMCHSSKKGAKAAEMAVPVRLLGTTRRKLGRTKLLESLRSSLNQICQPVGLDMTKLVDASAAVCCADDENQAVAVQHRRGAETISLDSCRLVYRAARKAEQQTLDGSAKRVRLTPGMHRTAYVPLDQGRQKKPAKPAKRKVVVSLDIRKMLRSNKTVQETK